MTSRNYDLLKPPSPTPRCPKQYATATASLIALGGAVRGAGRHARGVPNAWRGSFLRSWVLAARVREMQSAACFSDRFAPKGDHGELLPEED